MICQKSQSAKHKAIHWFHVTSYNVANTSFRHFDSASRPATDRVSMSVSGDNHASRCDSWVYQQTRKRHRQKAGFTITVDLPFWTAKVTIRETWVSREEDYGLEGSCQQKEQRSQTLVCSRHFVDGTWILLLLLGGGGGGVLFVCLFLLGFCLFFEKIKHTFSGLAVPTIACTHYTAHSDIVLSMLHIPIVWLHRLLVAEFLLGI